VSGEKRFRRSKSFSIDVDWSDQKGRVSAQRPAGRREALRGGRPEGYGKKGGKKGKIPPRS